MFIPCPSQEASRAIEVKLDMKGGPIVVKRYECLSACKHLASESISYHHFLAEWGNFEAEWAQAIDAPSFSAVRVGFRHGSAFQQTEESAAERGIRNVQLAWCNYRADES